MINPNDFEENKNMEFSFYTFAMWATFTVNLISPQQKQGANGGWATGYLEPWTVILLTLVMAVSRHFVPCPLRNLQLRTRKLPVRTNVPTTSYQKDTSSYHRTFFSQLVAY